MNVHLSFDVEVWCNNWQELDQRFPAAFDRYVWGRSARGDYALPKTLEILQRHGLQGVFFVEPLFAARFGLDYLHTITRLILDAGQDVQLHLHTEWVDEISPGLIADCSRKRQHISAYTLAEQQALITHGMQMLQSVGVPAVNTFRAGSFACNRDTFRALQGCGIALDSSLNACYEVSGADLHDGALREAPALIDGVSSIPVAVFLDGRGRLRPAQVGGCSFAEMREAMELAAEAGATEFVIVSHNFEMLKPGRSDPDNIVVRRFERLCEMLGQRRRDFPTAKYAVDPQAAMPAAISRPPVSRMATLTRLAEQLRRRWQ